MNFGCFLPPLFGRVLGDWYTFPVQVQYKFYATHGPFCCKVKYRHPVIRALCEFKGRVRKVTGVSEKINGTRYSRSAWLELKSHEFILNNNPTSLLRPQFAQNWHNVVEKLAQDWSRPLATSCTLDSKRLGSARMVHEWPVPGLLHHPPSRDRPLTESVIWTTRSGPDLLFHTFTLHNPL